MKRILSLALSLLLIFAIYSQINLSALRDAMLACDPVWLVLSLLMVIPITLLTATRFTSLMPRERRIGFPESYRLILAASSLNLALPSKMGDIAKAYFLKNSGAYSGSESLALVIFEKATDMLALLAWCFVGLCLMPQLLPWPFAAGILTAATLIAFILYSKSATAVLAWIAEKSIPERLKPSISHFLEALNGVQTLLRTNPRKAASVVTQSVALWFLHLLQIAGFTLALDAIIPFSANLALAPLSILAGLVPLTFAGIGTRDAAAILLYAPYLSVQAGAILGLLMTARYLLPGIAGLPYLKQYAGRAGIQLFGTKKTPSERTLKRTT